MKTITRYYAWYYSITHRTKRSGCLRHGLKWNDSSRNNMLIEVYMKNYGKYDHDKMMKVNPMRRGFWKAIHNG